MDRAGFVGGDGAVHHGFMDVALFRTFPGSVLLAASDEVNLRAALEFMREYEDGATFLRYPRDDVPAEPIADSVPAYVPGRALLVRPALERSAKVAVLAYGTCVYEALRAVTSMGSEADGIAVYDARFAKPIDLALLRKLVRKGTRILTVEDHSTVGGFGSCVLEACNEDGLATDGIVRLGMPERWIYQDSRSGQLAEAGIDAAGIAASLRELIATEARTHEVLEA